MHMQVNCCKHLLIWSWEIGTGGKSEAQAAWQPAPLNRSGTCRALKLCIIQVTPIHLLDDFSSDLPHLVSHVSYVLKAPPEDDDVEIGTLSSRHDLDGRRASPRADHRRKIWASLVLRPICIVDAIVNCSSTGTKATSLVSPAAIMRPALCFNAA